MIVAYALTVAAVAAVAFVLLALLADIFTGGPR